MKQTFIALLFLFSLSAISFAQSAEEQTILKLEDELRTAMLSNGVPTFERLIDPEMHNLNQFGQQFDRTTWINLFRTFKPGTLEHRDLKVQLVGNTALVRGKLREVSTSAAGRAQHLMFLHVWVKRAEGWKLLTIHQAFDVAEGTVLPAGWNGQSSYYFLIGTDKETKHGGAASAFIKSKHNETTNVSTGLTQAIKADAYRGKRIRLTGYVKGHVEYGQAFPWLRVNADHQEGDVLSFDNRLSDGFFVRPDWSSFTIVLDVPAQAAVINFGFQLNGRGHVWLDDWALEVVENTVPSTNLGMTEAALKRIESMRKFNAVAWQQMVETNKQRLPSLPAAPANLDFETAGKQ